MNASQIITEVEFNTTTSSGPGGQHANKTETAVELRWNIATSQAISENERHILLEKLSSRLTKDNVLIIVAQDSRSQHKNKDIVIKRFLEFIKQNVKRKAPRKKTRPSKMAKLKRLNSKKKTSEKKANRQKPRLDF
jgi:ribosome-associated protein